MQPGYLEEDRYPIMAGSHLTHEHGWLTDGDSNMIPLWFHGDCMPKVLTDNDDLSDSEESDNACEKDFVVNAWLSPQFVKYKSILY